MSNDIKPSQEQFTNDEKAFLKTFLPGYSAKVEEIKKIGTGPKRIGGAKGDKKQWIEENVYPAYCSKFDVERPGGPNLSTLKKKITRWFHNSIKPNVNTSVPQPPPKPRATNAMSLFGAAYKTAITERMATRRIERGLTPKEANFELYREVLPEMFHALDPETRSHYEAEAIKHNAKLEEPPSKDEIYANQESIATQAQALLKGLSGWEWGQCGDVAFFVQGAYRDQKGNIKTFTMSLSDDPNTVPFPSQVPDYDQLRGLFKEWAKKHLPLPAPVKYEAPTAPSSKKLVVTLDPTGRPLLPDIDIEDVPPRAAKTLLKDYITAAWNYALPSGEGYTDVPWNTIKEYLVVCIEIASFQTLYPQQMSTEDAYRMYVLLRDAQRAEIPSPLQFKITRETLNALATNDADIEEITDPANLSDNGSKSPKPQVSINSEKGQKGKRNTTTILPNFSPAVFGALPTSALNSDNAEKANNSPASAIPEPQLPPITAPVRTLSQSTPSLLLSKSPPRGLSPMSSSMGGGPEGKTTKVSVDPPTQSSPNAGTANTPQGPVASDSLPPVKRPVGRPKGVKRKGHPAVGAKSEPVAKKIKVTVPTGPQTKKPNATQPDQPTRRSGRIHEEGYGHSSVTIRK